MNFRALIPALVTTVAAVAVVAPNAHAASDYFMKVDGITGESQANGMQGYIDIDGFSFQAEQLGTAVTGGGMGAGKAQFDGLEVTKPVDAATPQLFQRLGAGTHLASVEVVSRSTATAPYVRYCFQNALITSQKQEGASGDNVHETLKFSVLAAGQQFTRQNPDGTLGNSVFGGWDLKTNMALTIDKQPSPGCSRAAR